MVALKSIANQGTGIPQVSRHSRSDTKNALNIYGLTKFVCQLAFLYRNTHSYGAKAYFINQCNTSMNCQI